MQVLLEAEAPRGNSTRRVEQFRAVATAYFTHGFRDSESGRQRLDPQDVGAQYRNVVGFPGGVSGPLMRVLEQVNALTGSMPLLEGGKGGPYQPDEKDEFVVFVYDSTIFPFFQVHFFLEIRICSSD